MSQFGMFCMGIGYASAKAGEFAGEQRWGWCAVAFIGSFLCGVGAGWSRAKLS